MTETKTTPEMIELAVKIAKQIADEPDEAYGNCEYLAALAAIIKTTEQLADWHERTGCQYSSPTLKHKIRNGDFLK